MSAAGSSLFLGIDGGGTRCRARLRDIAGDLIGEAVGGSANVHSAPAAALDAIVAVVRDVLAGRLIGDVHLGLGLAGVVSAGSGREVARQLTARLAAASITVDNDALIACLGAHAGRDGGIVIAGTGSAALALIGGKRHELGGWGFALGDDGSGALMGRAAVRHAILTLDGLAEAGALARAVLDQLGRDRDGPTRWSAAARPADYAAFAGAVIAAAKAGDPAGVAILTQARAGIDAMARRLIVLGVPAICFVGGLADVLTEQPPADVAGTIGPPLHDATDGAVMLARLNAGLAANWD